MERSAKEVYSGDPGARAVLIVDDTDEGGTAIEQACHGISGTVVQVVTSAVEAVRLLEGCDQPVCAVVTDIRMPRMDGLELLQFIRSHPRHAAMPVIVVTADTEPDSRQRAYRLGANAYFTKPFSPRAIRHTLEELIHAS